jgi:hypothetical protein
MADESQPGYTPPAAVAASDTPASSVSPAQADRDAARDPFAERPELYVGAAFAGGLAVAGLLRLLGR